MRTDREAIIQSLFDEYIEMYAARDDRLTARFSENFTGYTGGGDFLVKNRDEWVKITRQDFAQVPNRIRIEMLDLALQDISEEVVAVTAFFHIHLPIIDRVLSQETARLVLVFRLERGEWMIAHSGISIPYYLVREGEVYPLKGLEDRNKELEAQLEEKSRALAWSEVRFRTLVENLNDVLFALTPDGRFRYLSPQWQDAVGYEPSESIGQSFERYVHPDDFPACFSMLQKIVEADASLCASRGTVEFRVRCKDASFKWYIANVSRLTDPGDGSVMLVGIGRDVTQAKQADEALKASEKRFRDMVNTTDGIVWEADATTFTFTFISNKAERLLGFPAEDWLQPGFWVEHLHPEDQSWAPEYCASCTGRLEPHDFEYRFIAKDGRVVWLRDIVTVVPENDRPRWLRGVMIDISAKKQIEAELEKAHKMIEEVQHLSKLGGWQYDRATGNAQWTKEVYNIHGVPNDFDFNDASKNIEFYYPEDRPTIAQAFNRAIEHAEPYDLEMRLLRADGQTIWVRTLGAPHVKDGQVVSITGNIMDITQRKIAEEKICASEAHFRLLTENVSDVVWKTDRDFRFTYISPADERLRGYRADEVIGHHVFEMFTADGVAVVTEKMRQRHEAEQHGDRLGFLTFEAQHHCKDGRLIWGEVLSKPERDAHGTITGYHGITREITERKQMQDQVHQLAFYDPLTKLPNRRLLNDRLSQTMAASKRSACYGAVMILDLDNLKPLNDTHGHLVGDLLLIEVARRLTACLREMDTVARFGGDEFVVVLNDLNTDKAESTSQACIIAEKIRISLSEPYLLTVSHDAKADSTIEHRCSASIGVVVFIGNEGSQDDVLNWADAAMYQAKDAGRNLIRFYRPKASVTELGAKPVIQSL